MKGCHLAAAMTRHAAANMRLLPPVLLLLAAVLSTEAQTPGLQNIAALEQRLAALEQTCGDGTRENELLARLDAQDRAMARSASRHRKQVEDLEAALAAQALQQNETAAALQGLLSAPAGLAELRGELRQASARLEADAAARAEELARAAAAAEARAAALDGAQSQQKAEVGELAEQVRQLAKAQSQNAANVASLRKKAEEIIAAVSGLADEVHAKASAAAAQDTKQPTTIEHHVVFVPPDTMDAPPSVPPPALPKEKHNVPVT